MPWLRSGREAERAAEQRKERVDRTARTAHIEAEELREQALLPGKLPLCVPGGATFSQYPHFSSQLKSRELNPLGHASRVLSRQPRGGQSESLVQSQSDLPRLLCTLSELTLYSSSQPPRSPYPSSLFATISLNY